MMENNSEQYFPTYIANNRDILLIEFEEAQKIANGQTKLYGQVTNIIIAIIAIVIPLFFEGIKSSDQLQVIKEYSIQLSIILGVLGALLLRYFVDLQKQITINARKVITLRTMLGLDYGTIQLTLPNWRVEGANNPFALKYFNGWFKFESMPFLVLLVGINLIWYLATKNEPKLEISLWFEKTIWIAWWWGNVFISLSYYSIFRTNLNDRHETNYLNIVKRIAKTFNVKLMPNFEYILYRAKLSYIELDRLSIDYYNLKKALVEIEEHNFFKNSKGYSFKSLLRGILSQIPYFRKKYNFIKSGGSTITMQLSRTLFIPSNQNEYKRKVLEILLSSWLSKQFSKDDILKLYIASVQYEKRVEGLANAIKYFFTIELISKRLSNEESFFLVERLSNITSTFNEERIKMLLKRVSLQIDKEELDKIYQSMREKGLLSQITP